MGMINEHKLVNRMAKVHRIVEILRERDLDSEAAHLTDEQWDLLARIDWQRQSALGLLKAPRPRPLSEATRNAVVALCAAPVSVPADPFAGLD